MNFYLVSQYPLVQQYFNQNFNQNFIPAIPLLPLTSEYLTVANIVQNDKKLVDTENFLNDEDVDDNVDEDEIKDEDEDEMKDEDELNVEDENKDEHYQKKTAKQRKKLEIDLTKNLLETDGNRIVCQGKFCSEDAKYKYRKRNLCKKHYGKTMYDKCVITGCTRCKIYNYEGCPPEFCAVHKTSSMVNVKSKRCLKCTRFAIFNFPGSLAEYCTVHKQKGMINLKTVRCKFEGCLEMAVFGYKHKKRLRCKDHREPDMTNLKNFTRTPEYKTEIAKRKQEMK